MKKKITFIESPDQYMPMLCEECGREIEDGDECWYIGEGIYICSSEECIKEW